MHLERSSFPNKTRPILAHFWRIFDAFLTHFCYCRRPLKPRTPFGRYRENPSEKEQVVVFGARAGESQNCLLLYCNPKVAPVQVWVALEQETFLGLSDHRPKKTTCSFSYRFSGKNRNSGPVPGNRNPNVCHVFEGRGIGALAHLTLPRCEWHVEPCQQPHDLGCTTGASDHGRFLFFARRNHPNFRKNNPRNLWRLFWGDNLQRLKYHWHGNWSEINPRKYSFAFAFVLILTGQLIFRIHVNIDTLARLSLSLS